MSKTLIDLPTKEKRGCMSGEAALPWYTTVSYEPFHKQLFEKAFQILLGTSRTRMLDSGSPFPYHSPEQLRSILDFTLQSKRLNSKQLIVNLLETLIGVSPNPAHPFYLDRDVAGIDRLAVAADFLTTTMTSPAASFLFAPVLTLQELEVLKGVRTLLGYPTPEHGDGTICSDPCLSSITAVNCAIYSKFKSYRDIGFSGMRPIMPKLSIITSEFASPYWEKICTVSGLGFEALERVKGADDGSGRMNIGSLVATIDKLEREGRLPIMVVATLGTDPHGAIDPIRQISQICANNRIWFHVDGTVGGPLIYCKDSFKSARLTGIHLCDSFLMGVSPMLGIPYSCSILVTKQHSLLHEAVGMRKEIPYIFQENALYDCKVDRGDHSLETSRRGSVFSLWLMWKLKGRVGLGLQLERSMSLASSFYEILLDRDNFEVVAPPETSLVLFQYKPTQVHLKQSSGMLISRKIKMRLLAGGGACLGLCTLPGHEDEWFVVSCSNPNTTIESLTEVLCQVKRAAHEIFDANESFTPKSERTNLQVPEDTEEKQREEQVEGQVQLMMKVFGLLQEKGTYFQSKRDEPVLEFRTPEELRQEMDLTLNCDDDPVPGPYTDDDIIGVLDKMIFYSVHQAHPLYIYHVVSSGADPYSIIADYFAAVLTANCQSYDTSPLYTLMEQEVCLAARSRLGYSSSSEPWGGDGLFLPSGSVSVMTAFYVARATMFPETIEGGLQSFPNLKLVAFMSENAHYCPQKAALSQGLGIRSVVLIPADTSGAMDVEKLNKRVIEAKAGGGTPFFVHATAGTTVLGAFDPIREISEVCSQHGLWLHLDGSIGGGYMFSDQQQQQHKLKYAHLAHSINFSVHKTLGLSGPGSVLLFRGSGLLEKAFGGGTTSSSSSSNLLPNSGICWERRPDVLKMWLTWKAKGTQGLGLHIDHTFKLKEFCRSEMRRPERVQAFKLYKQHHCHTASVCFYYLPTGLRGLEWEESPPELISSKLELAAALVQKRMFERGIPIGVFRDSGVAAPGFLKMHLMSSGTTQSDIVHLLDLIDETCHDIITC